MAAIDRDVYCWLHQTVIFCVEEIISGIETTRYVSSLHSYMCLIKVLDFERKLLFSALLTQIFFRYIDMCMKDTDLLIKNNVQPILDFQKKTGAERQMWNPPPLTCCC